MTDRHAGYVVTLAQDIREDDTDRILSAIRMIKHVVGVEPIVSDIELHIAERRVRTELYDKFWEFLKTLR